MDKKIYEELMEIPFALNDLPIIKSELSYKTDDPQMTRNEPTFKKPLCCQVWQVIHHIMQFKDS